MKELDVNTQQKNLLEEDKLQQELFKLSRSGRRLTNQIIEYERSVAAHFIDVTCKTDHVTDNRKNSSFQVIDLRNYGRPVSAVQAPRSRVKASTKPRPITAAAIHHVPSGEAESTNHPTEKLGRADIERIHRERSDKFYHHKIDKMMSMMEYRNAKRRSVKSAPPTTKDKFDVSNIPEVLRETKNRPMSRSEAEFEMKKMRASILSGAPTLLYGEIKEDLISAASSNNATSAEQREKNYPPPSRNVSKQNLLRRTSTAATIDTRRRSSRMRNRNSDSSADTVTDLDLERRASVAAEKRRGSMMLPPRRPSLKPPMDDSDASDLSESEKEQPKARFKRVTYQPKRAENAEIDAIGQKYKKFQEGRYPSRFLNPNPDYLTRQRPFPVILDTEAYNAFCKNVARVKTTSQMKKQLEDLISGNWQHKPATPFYAWDTGPKF